MRLNSIARLTALAAALMMLLSIPALAESCTLCGRDSGGDYYLCADCLLELLEDKDISGGMTITGADLCEDGSVLFTWQGGQAPYTVRYELLDAAPTAFGWTAGRGIRSNGAVLSQLVPGVSYVLTVEDAAGGKAEAVYYASAPENGNEIGAKIRIHTKVRNGRQVLEYPFSAADIQEQDREHGLYMKLAYSMLRKTRNYAFSVTVEAPNGFADTVLSGSMTLNYGKSEVPAWGFIALDDYFACLARYYGGVPTGEYMVTMNFDGKPACSDSFYVNE